MSALFSVCRMVTAPVIRRVNSRNVVAQRPNASRTEERSMSPRANNFTVAMFV